MSNLLRFAIFAALLAAASGCGKHSSESKDISYSFEVNCCRTGEHSAASTEDYCKNLVDHSLNHYCAEGMRKDAFDKGCQDTTVKWEDSDASEIDESDPYRNAC
ncbi:MAG: hypothetical protein JST04_17420 [Bdellovibrionales bacterium]|nr:hypothetical protein [Bdellovibrionales bacterium]